MENEKVVSLEDYKKKNDFETVSAEISEAIEILKTVKGKAENENAQLLYRTLEQTLRIALNNLIDDNNTVKFKSKLTKTEISKEIFNLPHGHAEVNKVFGILETLELENIEMYLFDIDSNRVQGS